MQGDGAPIVLKRPGQRLVHGEGAQASEIGDGKQSQRVAAGEPDAVKVARPVREGELTSLEGVGYLLHACGRGFESHRGHFLQLVITRPPHFFILLVQSIFGPG